MATILVAGCSDLTEPVDTLLSTADLLILPLQAGAPDPGSASFWVNNAQRSTHRLIHADAVNNPYLEVTFPVGSLLSLNGVSLGSSDSVLVTVDSRSGQYGFNISPNGLAFRDDSAPTVRFFFAWYADASIADASDKYQTPSDYAEALDIWWETTVDLWRVAAGSRPDGTDIFAATVDAAGDYVLAAPR
ncbi:MAG: hypothetical protein JSW51_09530 [Gemmatimonadota bacterium]|nr:MAG: hypothetical protein JSW51_09530 [Gemmatimonadota bacterium]